jgi:hypothetical protein
MGKQEDEEVHMEFIGFGLVCVLFIGGAVLFARLMQSAGRNEGSNHGGGLSGASIYF